MAKIMIMEDEGLVALQIKEGLENMGYTVPCILDNGAQCLNKVREHTPDLVLMDIRLKGKIDGIQSAKLIREHFFIPVIFLTAHSDEKTLSQATLAEAYGYVLKPFEEKALKAAIEVALYKAGRERVMRDYTEWFSLIFRSTGEAVIIADTSGNVKYINELTSELTGYLQAEVYDHKLDDIFQTFDLANNTPRPTEYKTAVSEGSILNFNNYLLQTKSRQKVAVDYTIAPLQNRTGSTVGVIIIFRKSEQTGKRENTVQFDLDSPLKMQRDFLPAKNKTIPGIKADYLFLPSMFGSGDIFNYFSLDNEHIGFYLLDVMGHGFSSALFTITLQRLLLPDIQSGGILKQIPDGKAAANPETGSLPPFLVHPADVIKRLNHHFLFQENEYPFFTMIYGIFNKHTKKCLITRAGHTPPLLQHKKGGITVILDGGPAIGVIEDIEVVEKELTLQQGDRLYLYSDGLVDSKNNLMKEFGRERFLALLEKYKTDSLPVLVQSLELEIQSWRDVRKFDDDIAFLVIEVK